MSFVGYYQKMRCQLAPGAPEMTVFQIVEANFWDENGTLADDGSELALVPEGFGMLQEGEYEYEGTEDEAEAALIAAGFAPKPLFED